MVCVSDAPVPVPVWREGPLSNRGAAVPMAPVALNQRGCKRLESWKSRPRSPIDWSAPPVRNGQARGRATREKEQKRRRTHQGYWSQAGQHGRREPRRLGPLSLKGSLSKWAGPCLNTRKWAIARTCDACMHAVCCRAIIRAVGRSIDRRLLDGRSDLNVVLRPLLLR